MGPVEIEYVGTEDFMREELLDMVKAVADLYQGSGGGLTDPGDNGESGSSSGCSTGGSVTGTTIQIATILGVSNGPDLIFAAGAKLHFVDGQDTFTRKQLLSEAKTSSKFYKKNYSGNLTKILQSLVSDARFNEPANHTYALTDASTKAAKAQLAN